MSMSTVSFLTQLALVFFACITLTYDLNGFKSRINWSLLSVGSFQSAFLCAFQLCLLLFIVTPCLSVAVQTFVNLIPNLKKNRSKEKIAQCLLLINARLLFFGIVSWRNNAMQLIMQF